jgi:hypothetical protein
MKKIAIFGAGISGLTIAHELSKFKDKYKVSVYESNSMIGGLARSARSDDGCATEYCWRVVFGFYANLLKIMSEIPIDGNNHSVLDNLAQYKHLNINDSKQSMLDKLKIYYNVFYGFTSCDNRMKGLDNLSWWDSIDGTTKNNVYREIGPWLGMDRLKGSYNSVIKVGMEMQMYNAYMDHRYHDYVTTKPTSEALFDPWQLLLKSQGVEIFFNNELTSINVINNIVESASVTEKLSGLNKKIIADIYVFCVPIQVLARLVKTTTSLLSLSPKIQKLADTCTHIQLSFQVYFNKHISLGNNTNAFLIIDAPWDLIILSYDAMYNTPICINKNNNDHSVQGAWSVAVCTSFVPGIVFNKPFINCTYNEIIIELWAQLMASNKLKNVIKENNRFNLSQKLVVKWSKLWPTYYYENNKLHTIEPKFTNNVHSLSLRPSIRTPIKNLFISTGYVAETIDIFSMESACISGIMTAHLIDNDVKKPYIAQRPSIFYPFRKLDQISYNLGIPNLSMFILFIFIIMIIYIVI